MDTKVKLRRNVYIIIAGVVLLALAIQLTSSEYVLQFSRNEAVQAQAGTWKPEFVDKASLASSGSPYCIAYEGSESYSADIKHQAEQTLIYMKKPFRSFDLNGGTFQPDSCAAVIVATERLELLGGDGAALAGYVENGGYVFLADSPELNDTFYRLYRKLGIVAARSTGLSRGIVLTSNVLIGEKGLVTEDPIIANTSVIVELDDKSRLLAKSTEGIPLLWDYSYGKGKFMVFNGSMMSGKVNRGLLAGALSMLEPDFIYPIFNSKIFYIDDFPAPIPRGIDDDIFRDYRRDIPAFFKEIWWPDMLKVAKRYDVKYTAALIESYNDRVEPPFHAPIDADLKGLLGYGREVLKSGGEIGLHGYNHQSLQRNRIVADWYGYRSWRNPEHMVDSIREAVEFASKAFPDYKMISYVPPSNVLSPEGREALKKGWPGMAVISSLYAIDMEKREYAQEFEVAPDGILEMPRLTSGYYEKPFDRWMMANGITLFGFFSHFIHPDDLLSDDRSNNMSWEELYREFNSMLERLDRVYPWLRHSTSSEAAVDVEEVLTSKVDIRRQGGKISGTIEQLRTEQHFILRTERSIQDVSGCKVRKIDDSAYLVTAVQANFEITLGD
ncbi:DUF2194 domain-containing protein [Paenibacillus oceani]|uniref:DUF2194 domain-containing protein n=1 Tax=Paenibacillus oceani TaxID=2772510 RepID=A0A927H291_9BACL|nr:DUF2194 domain-containing protein [Paenibacillus oceani]MBD2864244.1 DUF2194 domain-containing protein [Paenibacillus oceani]